MSEDEFMDFITQDEMNEILAIEAELGVDIDLDEILNEVEYDESEIDNDDEDDLELG
jgi:hypothetical protein